MSTQENSRTSLFLMELIIVIMFFALASAVCLRLFVSAHLLSEKDKNLSQALVCSQNLSEGFYGCNGRIGQMKNLYPDAFFTAGNNDTDGSLVLFYDENWNELDSSLSGASYEAIIEVKKEAADKVYSDVNEYGVALKGDAMTGKITIIDLRGLTQTFSAAPEDENIIIHTNTIDTYIGE